MIEQPNETACYQVHNSRKCLAPQYILIFKIIYRLILPTCTAIRKMTTNPGRKVLVFDPADDTHLGEGAIHKRWGRYVFKLNIDY